MILLATSIFGWYKDKQEAKTALYKIVWQALCAIAAFTIKHWQFILPALMLGYCLLKISGLHNALNQANNAKTAIYNTYIAHLAQDKAAAKKRADEIAAKTAIANIEKQAIKNTHSAAIAKIMKANDNEKTLTTSRINAYRDGLRLALDRENSARLSKNDTDRTASTDSDTTAARYIETLEQAGAVCAADYNLCYDYVQSQQRKIGVEN